MPKELSVGAKEIRKIVQDELKFYATKEDLDSKHNQVMNTLDNIYGFLKEMKQEMSVMNHRVYRIQDPKLENHEKRITKLEVQLA